jgi:hypothetical protein
MRLRRNRRPDQVDPKLKVQTSNLKLQNPNANFKLQIHKGRHKVLEASGPFAITSRCGPTSPAGVSLVFSRSLSATKFDTSTAPNPGLQDGGKNATQYQP